MSASKSPLAIDLADASIPMLANGVAFPAQTPSRISIVFEKLFGSPGTYPSLSSMWWNVPPNVTRWPAAAATPSRSPVA